MQKTITTPTHSPQEILSSSYKTVTKGSKAIIERLEGWKITANCWDVNDKDLEQTQIIIQLPGNKVFTGSIQDLSSLLPVLRNAYHEVMQVAEHRFDDKKREQEVLDCAIELQNFMKLFE